MNREPKVPDVGETQGQGWAALVAYNARFRNPWTPQSSMSSA